MAKLEKRAEARAVTTKKASTSSGTRKPAKNKSEAQRRAIMATLQKKHRLWKKSKTTGKRMR